MSISTKILLFGGYNKNLDFSLNWKKINSVLESERNRSLEVLKKVLLENHSNNTKALNKVQRISACKKYVYKLKILLNKINKLGIGPQGFGGDTTALAVNIETAPTHIAGLPVAVNIGCHVTRHATKEVK